MNFFFYVIIKQTKIKFGALDIVESITFEFRETWLL